jgi:hypothetical protein
LHLNKLRELEWRNYRTTATILTLANRFQVKANQAQGYDTRWLPEPTNPEQCFERPGDAVRLLVYPDLASAETFLDPLVESISEQISGWQEKHSLQWRLAARARLFCSDTYHVNQNRVKFLEFMPVSQAKGREFESCIAFCIFDLSTQYGQMESYTKWYTQLTRARRRLLIVTTQDQLNAVGQDIFCPKTDGDENINIVQWLDYSNPQEVKDALDWIIEFRSGLDGSETGRKGLIDIVIDGILQASPILYYDIYDVLNRYDISGQNLIDLEIEIVNYLFAKSEVQDCLKDYLNRPEVQDIPRLLTLIHRCLGQSWQAATIAQSLRETAPQTYGEIITGICQDLQHRGLPFEAKRLVNLYSLDSAIENHSNTIFSNHNGKLLLTLSNWVEQQLTLH